MGVIAELIQIASSAIKTWHGAPGDAVVVTGSGERGLAVEAEVYAPAGFLSRPPKDARGVFIPLGGSRKYGVVISGHNYKVSISLAGGETAIFSTTADGATLKANIVLKADGTIEFNGNTKRLVTWDDFDSARSSFMTALNAHTHPVPGVVPGGGATTSSAPTTPMTLDITSAKTSTLKTGG